MYPLIKIRSDFDCKLIAPWPPIKCLYWPILLTFDYLTCTRGKENLLNIAKGWVDPRVECVYQINNLSDYNDYKFWTSLLHTLIKQFQSVKLRQCPAAARLSPVTKPMQCFPRHHILHQQPHRQVLSGHLHRPESHWSSILDRSQGVSQFLTVTIQILTGPDIA